MKKIGSRIKLALVIVIPLVSLSCTNLTHSDNCEVSASDNEKLKKRIYKYMDATGFDSSCEELSNEPEYLKRHGCALYGNATNGQKNPRTGRFCESYLDGGYYVIFDKNSLEPKEIVLISW